MEHGENITLGTIEIVADMRRGGITTQISVPDALKVKCPEFEMAMDENADRMLDDLTKIVNTRAAEYRARTGGA